jgi:hypothetical protein
MVDPLRKIARRHLSDERREELVRGVLAALVDCPYVPSGTPERAFTGDVLAPACLAAVEAASEHGVSLRGDGLPGQVRPVVYRGHSFYPDLTLEFRGELLLAVEVKLVGRNSSSQRIATAIGQASLYARNYEYAVCLWGRSTRGEDPYDELIYIFSR